MFFLPSKKYGLTRSSLEKIHATLLTGNLWFGSPFLYQLNYKIKSDCHAI
jgi:hypothetical protein